jgi:predicted extracellular nuclease
MKYYLLICFFSLLFAHHCLGQDTSNFKIMCYNVENYFDCVDDSLTNDSEYLPGGIRGWNHTKYRQKQTNIAKVIAAVGGWEPPALVGLCEVKSRKCLVDLTRYSGLKSFNYKFLHFESPDARGIDVALLYQPQVFKPLQAQPIRIDFPNAPKRKTRDVLYASGIVPSGDTLHVFVCHFPSRLGGELESENSRMYVASKVRAKVDSLFSLNMKANIVIMGDFNDYPTNRSIFEVLEAKKIGENTKTSALYNLVYHLHSQGIGSHKHQGEWGALDHIIVSGQLVDSTARLTIPSRTAHFFDAPFLLEDDSKYLGKMPYRTYAGMKYQGGYSDHLPVYVDLKCQNKPKN